MKSTLNKGENKWLRKHQDGAGNSPSNGRKAAKAPSPSAAAAVEVNTGTPQTRKLCEDISRLSCGVCILGFSRGKDSIAAWLYLRNFFTRIIPFHVASVPHLRFVDSSLDYYEEFFKTSIIRYMDGDCLKALSCLCFQPIEDESDIDAMELYGYSKHDIIAGIKRELNIPNAWCAFGINATDSIDRRIYVNKCHGRHDDLKTFYPCYSWTGAQIIDYIKANNVKLPQDYLLAKRTFAGIPNVRHLQKMKELMPDDFERIKLMFPFIEARLARNEFRIRRGACQA